MKKYDAVVIHFGEIWLKGRNRGAFVSRLYNNVQSALKDEDYGELENARDRFVVHLNKKSDIESIQNRLKSVFGIAWFAPMIICSSKISDIMKNAKGLYGKKEKVRIVAHRSYKLLDYNSLDLVKKFIDSKSLGFELDKDAENEISINITKDNAFISNGRTKGAGGLPVGCSGKAVVLLSGGIDSPVASVYAMKKGLYPIYIHMHAFPKNEQAQKSKIGKILKNLEKYSGKQKSYFVPSHLFQAAVATTDKKYELILFKRFIYKLAKSIAEAENAEVIVTGDSLGQVASQTVKNLIASEHDIGLFVMRPLIGFDKQEIINEAKRLDTFALSIQKYPDVCSLRAKNPTTSANPKVIDGIYNECKLDTVLEQTIRKSLVVESSR